MNLEQRVRSTPSSRRLNQVARDLKIAVLEMSNGTEIRGRLHLPPGSRILDLLNLQAEQYIAVTEATISSAGARRECPFIALNKSFIVSIREADSPDKSQLD